METSEIKYLLLSEFEAIENIEIRNNFEKGGVSLINQKLIEFKRKRKMAILRLYLMIISFIILIINSLFHFLGSFSLGCVFGLLIAMMISLIVSLHSTSITKDRQILILELLIKLYN